MYTKLAVFGVFALFIVMIAPTAYAEINSVSLAKSFYTNEEGIVFEGKESTGKLSVFVIINDDNGDYVDMVSAPSSDVDGIFSTVPREVENIFSSKGTYSATAFTVDQKEEDGITIELEYDGDKVFLIPGFDLQLKPISDQTIEEEETLTFTAGITESLSDLEYSLEKNPPVGATIDSETGKFTWRPASSQSSGSYSFDIVVKKGGLEDRESVQVTVTDKSEPQQTTTTEPTKTTTEPPPEPTKTTTEPTGLAAFVDETKDPQNYVDRYNNEESYKKWFDDNYPNITIYQAVGLEDPTLIEEKIGECGTGTILINGTCTPGKAENALDNGGGCLIATAAYGSEMSPQVQFLREIRDGKVMSTETGASFMTEFNSLYYSFSPYIADYERENPVFKEIVKIGITPMLSSLSIMSFADSEQEILGYGIGVILMNLGMYVAAPAAMLFYGINKTRKKLGFNHNY